LNISIVIATYNSESTLGDTLSSIIGQTYEDFEVIVVDGGSVDATLDIIDSFADKRFRVVSEPDHGVYDALNKGCSMAAGIWLYVLGSDDVLNGPDALKSIAFDLTDPASVVYGGVCSNFLGERGKVISFPEPPELMKRFNFAPPLFHQGIFLRKQVFDDLNGYNLDYSVHADFDFMCRAALSDYEFSRSNCCIALYNARGISGASFRKYFRNSWEMVTILRANRRLNINWLLRLLKTAYYPFLQACVGR
jgi:glycosyltransferase involved in cell wall biosynthesis